jgi:hypothetical protein
MFQTTQLRHRLAERGIGLSDPFQRVERRHAADVL